jgi:hypothetical protein
MYPFIFRTFFARMDPERAHHLVMPVIRAFGVWPLAPDRARADAPDPRCAPARSGSSSTRRSASPRASTRTP